MSAGFRITPALWDKIHHFASFPQTGVSLQQMVLFGQNPSQGTLLKASQFLAEELPVRLAHRVKELDELPHNLSDMPSIKKVKNWYAQSFEELIHFPPIQLPSNIRQVLVGHKNDEITFPESKPNPSLGDAFTAPQSNVGNGNGFNKLKLRVPMERRSGLASLFTPSVTDIFLPSSLHLPPFLTSLFPSSLHLNSRLSFLTSSFRIFPFYLLLSLFRTSSFRLPSN
ncbi:hypothetical protein D9611_014036 [Ephemerocybe angulata]|uniref:Protein-serine/threonine kinase n=1 Tax=Ephemerocybe angulata TaxID=980116 RepID=A0A8H5ARQ2_9AGAR|nr:hypothetical protein D9611_014036 [Tulosesus angulatus]